MDLAAFIERTLDLEQASRVRRHVRECARCAHLIAEADPATSDVNESMAFVPAHVMESAMALVNSDSRESIVRRPGRLFFVQRFAAAAAAIAVCAAGYQLGIAFEGEGQSRDPLASELLFDLFDGSDDDGEFFALASNFDGPTRSEGTP